MSGPPPENLMDWPKARLATEVKRLREILYEHASQPADAPTSGGGIVDVAGDPHARGGVLLDVRRAVLMDYVDVALVDTKQNRIPSMMMVLEGRVNYQVDRTRQAFLFGTDGAAGLASQLIGLARRAGGEFLAEFAKSFKDRMEEMP